MQGSKNSFFNKSNKASHSFDDGTHKHHGSFKKKDYHHDARHKSTKKEKSPQL